MGSENNSLTSQLREAREASGLSQRDLTAMSGIQQAQLSKIENGSVDPRLTSLLNISRSLGLELVLVPRQFLPAIQSILKGKETDLLAYSLDEDEDE